MATFLSAKVHFNHVPFSGSWQFSKRDWYGLSLQFKLQRYETRRVLRMQFDRKKSVQLLLRYTCHMQNQVVGDKLLVGDLTFDLETFGFYLKAEEHTVYTLGIGNVLKMSFLRAIDYKRILIKNIDVVCKSTYSSAQLWDECATFYHSNNSPLFQCWCLWKRKHTFPCPGGAFVAQPDDISASKRGAWAKIARVTQTESQLVIATKTVATEIETWIKRRKKKTQTLNVKERGDILWTALGFRSVVFQEEEKRKGMLAHSFLPVLIWPSNRLGSTTEREDVTFKSFVSTV